MKNRLWVALFFCLQWAAISQPVHTQSLRGHVPAAVAKLKPSGQLELEQELHLAIGLPLRNPEALTNLLQRIYDPASPDYRHYLTPAKFAEAFAPTESDYQAVASFAKARGLRVTGTYSNRVLLDIAGSVSNIEKALHVKLRTFQHPKEKRLFFAPDTEPSLDLATPVLHISGLDNYLQPRPTSLVKTPQARAASALGTGSGPGGTLVGIDFRSAYAPGTALDGTGQSLALLEFDGYYARDVSNYVTVSGLPGVPLTNVYIDSFSGIPGGNNLEVALDIEMALSMAPGLSSIIVYEGNLANDVLNRIASDAPANQISSSWTYGIDQTTEQIFQQFAAQGESFFNASGDDDAWLGNVLTPCDDPNITIVGGTTLTTTGPGGAWVSETTWNWDVEFGADFDGQGSGGGISARYKIPSWQLGVDMSGNQGSTLARNVPDVAMAADNVYVIADFGVPQSVGGTSCAAPLWAAFAALANQQAAAHGRPTLGFLNPALYALGESQNYTNCFHDITTGNNAWSQSPSRYLAVPGYDLCTGWGTPAGSNLVNFLALDSLQISPSEIWSPGGMVGGPIVPSSQIYTLTNTGNMPFAWSLANTATWLNLSFAGGTLNPGGPAATVVASLNSAAYDLFPGIYSATIWFTNLIDGTVQSRSVSLSILKPPTILSQPSNVSLIGGMTATFTAIASGGLPLTGQWQFNGTNVASDPRISGSSFTLSQSTNIYGLATSALTISNVAPSDAGNYSLVASNVAGSATSAFAVLAVVPSGPVIIQQPASQTAFVGATIHFSVVADGTSPFSYQWRQNGSNLLDGAGLSGTQTPTLTIGGASSVNRGDYSVVVANSIDTVTSAPVTLNVQVILPGSQLIQNGGFETGNLASWIEIGSFASAAVKSVPSAIHSGHYGVLLESPGSLNYLTQSFPTVPGQPYFISLWLDSPDGITPNEFQVAWNNAVVFDQNNIPAIGWTNLQLDVTATNAFSTLQIGFRDDQSFLGLDDVQVFALADAAGSPYIATQPASLVTIQDGSATFNALSSGQFPLFYQWQFNGANIIDATNATLKLENLNFSQAGIYDVVVTNLLGSTVSSNAQLTVLTGQEGLITFDDLPYTVVPVPQGYNNLNWTNFDYLNSVANRNSGYGAGMVSAAKVAYNPGGAPASVSSSSPFSLFSAYLTAAWNDNLQVEVQGYNGTALIYDNKYTLSATSPTLVRFNYVGVTSVNFFSSGGTPHLGYPGGGTQFAMDNLNVFVTPNPPSSTPASVALMYAFNGFDGGHPMSALTQCANGNLYGTTEYGGPFGAGTVFSITTNGALTTLHSFNSTGNADGVNPVAALIQGADGNLYGTTVNGGANGDGAIFIMTPSGLLSTLASFNTPVTGGNPTSPLVQAADGNFYGVTPVGGLFNQGTVFSVTPNGVLTVLDSFNGTNGSSPVGALLQIGDGNFYGATTLGGLYGVGSIFTVSPMGGLATLASVTGLNAYPQGLLYGPDGKFYGTSQFGGSTDFGTVFSVTTSGAVSTVASFNYYTTGGYPAAGLMLGPNGVMYGTTTSGGSNGTTYFNGTFGGGVVFSITPNGNMTPLLSFQNTNGLTPQASLALGVDGNLYGTTSYGGLGFNGYFDSGDGVVFRLGSLARPSLPLIVAQPLNQTVPVSGKPTFSVKAAGASPLNYAWQRNGSPIAGATQSKYTADDVLLTNSGDQYSCLISNAYGAVLTSNAKANVVGPSGMLAAFNGANGGYPSSSLIADADGNLYGTTDYGGANGNGSVFKVTPSGVLSNLASFDFYVTGANPVSALLNGGDGYFYGTASFGGIRGNGTVFRMTADGVLTVVYAFGGADGAEPGGTLVQGPDGNFYGTTFTGGASQLGTVFKVTPSGNLTTLHSFNSADGANPQGTLVLGPGGIFYGTTANGGAASSGTVFQITPDGAINSLFSFNQTNGADPVAALTPSGDGGFYGTTTFGGISNYGTLFKITTNGALTTMFLFDGAHGINPHCTLVQGGDGSFYGTTLQGGVNNEGTVFSMTTNGLVTTLFSFQGANGTSPGAGLMQAADGNLYGTAVFGATGFDGQFSSGNGAVYRIAATVPPQPPVIVSQPASLTALVGNTATFSVSASSSTPLNYTWQCNGTNIPGATQNSYSIGPLQLSDSGSVFSCLIGNALSSVNTTNASLTVIAGIPGLITFDTLPNVGAPVPNGYFNLVWNNFYCATASSFDAPNGFLPGTISTNNVAYNFGRAGVGISSGTPFNLLSAYLTAAWNDGLQVEVQAYKGAALNYDKTYTLNATSPTLVTFNFLDVTSVRFIASGGALYPGYEGVGTQFVVDNMSVIQVPPPPNAHLPFPQPVTVEYGFGGSDGGHPVSGLAQGRDGNLYGTTEYGGANQLGTVFRLNSSGQLSTVVSFGGVNGAGPRGALLAGSDGTFYGMTAQGGSNGLGTVFNLSLKGALHTLYSFGGTDGAQPQDGLIQGSDGNFYGATAEGGAFGQGTVFSLDTNGVLATLHSFDGADGAYPYGTLAQGMDGNLYGTTESGGTNSAGTIFKMSTDGAMTNLVSFNYETTGGFPTAGLLIGSNGNFYGTTQFGGSNGVGTIFQLTPAGAFTTLYAFDDITGAEPYGSLTQGTDGFIYGTTQYGGTNDGGTIFGMTTNGTVVSLFSFQGNNGYYPQSGLAQGSDGAFYGAATYGGEGFNGYNNSGDGVIFRMGPMTLGTPPSIIAQPVGRIVPVGGAPNWIVKAAGSGPLSYQWQRNGSPIAGATQTSYGITSAQLTDGGTQISCVVSNVHGSVTTSNASLTLFTGSGSLFNFDGDHGGYPIGGIIQGADGNFHATTQYGGIYGQGTVFSVATNGLLALETSFDGTNGAQPGAALVQGSDGNYYGTTQSGGTYQNGTVFKTTPGGKILILYSFDGNNNGSQPNALIQASDGNFYGTTQEGGANGYGTIFRMSNDGTLTTLATFNNANGATPQGRLIQDSSGNLYGVTEDGGTNGYGTVYRLALNGTLTTLSYFNNGNGAYPQGGLTRGVDGSYYGTTRQGGTYSQGTVFRVTTNGVLTSLYSFSGPNGTFPQGALTLAPDGNLYGTTVQGGLYGDGTAFEISIGGTMLNVFSFEGINGAHPSDGMTIGLDGNFYGTVTYGGQGYDGLSSSGNGAVFRLAGNIASAAPLIITQPADQTVHVGQTATFTVTASSSTPLNYLWQRNGTNIPGATFNTYILNNVQPTDNASLFSCQISNPYASTLSSNALLTVLSGNGLPPPIIPLPQLVTVEYGFWGMDGGHPVSGLAEGNDGNLYGTTEYGGANQLGTVFRLNSSGQLSTVVSFGGVNGAGPRGALLAGSDGTFYGMTAQGGSNGLGTVFNLSLKGALHTLYSFGGTDGAQPQDGLIQGSDGNFYGTTAEGGAFGQGTVFSLDTNGVLATLHSFNGSDGAYPYGTLAQGLDGNLYGTTESGGTNGAGTVFRMSTDGAMTNLVSFNYETTGGFPTAGLLIGSNGNFYGTTQFGGSNGVGTIFQLTPAGAFTTLYAFDDITGAEPYGSLTQGTDGFIYGTTQYGGTNDGGTIFGMTTNGTVVSLFSFQGNNGYYPQSGLTQGADGAFYGAATYGGEGFNGYNNSGDGVIFRMGPMTLGTPPSIIAQPVGRIVPVGGAPNWIVKAAGSGPLSYQWQRNGSPIAGATQTSYGITSAQLTDGGTQISCVVSNVHGSVTTSNASLTLFTGSGSLFNFDGDHGGYPIGGIIQGADGNFHATTQYGGIYGQGTVFSVATNGLLALETSFDGTNGAQPGAALVQGSDGNYYGTTQSGGTYQNGTVFKTTPGGKILILYSFDGNNNGSQPNALIQASDGNFYGTTQEGGANGYGTIFRMSNDGTLTTLATFNNANGATPQGRLIQDSSGNLYGVTEDGGTNGYGTVYRLALNGTLTTLSYFNNGNGAYPQGGLTRGVDGSYYGTTRQGGTYSQGTVFRVTTNGVLTSLYSFSGPNGTFPQGALTLAPDGNLYGTTVQGGLYGDGTAFEISIGGTMLNVFSFEGINGAHPSDGMTIGLDGNFYGTVTYGGQGYDGLSSSGNGAVFRLAGNIASAAPLIITQPADQTVHVGQTATFTVTASSSTPLNYLWQRNGTNIPGATFNTYILNNVQPTDNASLFSCQISNPYASTLSSNALLTVGGPSLLQNGDFEFGTFAGWTAIGNFEGSTITLSAPFVHDGLFGAKLGPTGSPGYISQTITTVVGELYQISFWFKCDGLTPNELSLTWNGYTLFDRQNLPATAWSSFQVNAAASATNSVLTIGFQDDPSYLGLDDIAVYPIGIEPFEFRSVELEGGTVKLTWGATIGQIYQVQSTTDLSSGNWTALGDPLTAADSTVTVSESIGVSSAQFYRLVQAP